MDRSSIRCARCGRCGRLSAKRLVATYGPKIRMPDLALQLTGQCPNCGQDIYRRCNPYFPQISKLRPSAAP